MVSGSIRSLVLIVLVGLYCGSALALPIDWSGSLGFDTTMINDFRRTDDTVTAPKTPGTQGIESTDDAVHFQTYIFKLNPTLIVNDAVTIKGELSSGYIRGGFFGDNSTNTSSGTAGSNAYFHTSPAARTGLNVNQLYAELYADTALVKIGRYARNFGLGAVINGGTGSRDRFLTMYDGLQGEMKIGNFSLTPHWARISAYDNATDRAEPNGSRDVRETGITAAYENKTRQMVLALTFSKRFSESKNTLYNQSTDSTTSNALGKTEVTLLDAYLEKRWKNFKLAIEVPTMSGDYGDVYGAGSKSRLSTSGAIIETLWNATNKWDLGLMAGQVNGDKGSSNKFEALYLHPNFHIAELMFRYNYSAFNEANGRNIFDSSITNARFFRLHANYKADRWTWNLAFITAKAMEAAKNGKDSYHHEENYRFLANKGQSDDFGHELDVGFDYMWNPNVTISGFLGYWFVGDYYAFSNDPAGDLDVKNVLGSGLRLNVDF